LKLKILYKQTFSGPGTYSANGYIYASLAGKLKLVKQSEDTVKVEVHAPGEETVVPAVGDIVTCKVLSVNPR
jgi:exosome complex RNA-binding protein Csl4